MNLSVISEVFEHLAEKPLSNSVHFTEFRDAGNIISNKFYMSEEGKIYIKGTREVSGEVETVFLGVDLSVNTFCNMIMRSDSVDFNLEEDGQ